MSSVSNLNRWGFLTLYMTALLAPLSLFSLPFPGVWGPLCIAFVLVPILDLVIGVRDFPSEPTGKRHPYFRFLPYSSVPITLCYLIIGAYGFTQLELSFIEKMGLVLSWGVFAGIISINIAHELIHRKNKLDQAMGGLLLSMVSYGCFKVEHIRSHHVHVATPKDNSTARLNENIYLFICRSLYKNFLTALHLEQELCRRRGRSLITSELCLWYAISLGFCLILGLCFGIGGSLFFMGVSLVAAATLEVINYIEHYGLKRRETTTGFEQVSVHHSWNSPHLFSNLLLFNLPKHSDHHENPGRPYECLRHRSEAPQLPAGYGAMFLAALAPPLWKRIMNPRVQELNTRIQ